MVFDIQRFSTHDGPGIRTVVFLKGCPLHCPWCENPESQSPRAELFYDSAICIGCLDCMRAAGSREIATQTVRTDDGQELLRPLFLRDRIRSAEPLRGLCPSGALTVVGREMSVEEVMREVEKDRPFYGTGGGVTFSGGEPLAQPTFLQQLVQEAGRRGIDIAIETSLQAAWRTIEPLLPHVSLFLADLKHVNAGRYRAAVGGDLAVVLDNFHRLEACGAPVVVRIPVVPGFNDASLTEMLRFASAMSNVTEVHLLPYHTLGSRKYELLGRDYEAADLAALPSEELERYRSAAEAFGLQMEIGG